MPPLQLNHLFRVVDAETFGAARESSWLREVFAPSELRTTQRPDWSYTGLYFYGHSTYLELFEEGTEGPPGASGLAFAIEEAGATPALADGWRESSGEAEHRVVVRPIGDDTVPWFHIAHAVPDRKEWLKLWSMEYHADFLASWHPDRTPARGTSRAEVLERYAAVAGGPASPLLADVTAVRLALSPAESTFLDRHVAAFDARVRHVGGEARYIDGDGISIGVGPSSSAVRGVQDIVCRLARPVGRESITVGRLTIEVDGERAVLKFR